MRERERDQNLCLGVIQRSFANDSTGWLVRWLIPGAVGCVEQRQGVTRDHPFRGGGVVRTAGEGVGFAGRGRISIGKVSAGGNSRPLEPANNGRNSHMEGVRREG